MRTRSYSLFILRISKFLRFLSKLSWIKCLAKFSSFFFHLRVIIFKINQLISLCSILLRLQSLFFFLEKFLSLEMFYVTVRNLLRCITFLFLYILFQQSRAGLPVLVDILTLLLHTCMSIVCHVGCMGTMDTRILQWRKGGSGYIFFFYVNRRLEFPQASFILVAPM